jgi:hypothetical protein
MNTKLSTNFTLNSLKRALTPEDSSTQKDSKINSSTSKWFSDAFSIDVNDNDSLNKTPLFKVADYKNKPSTTFFRMLIKIITFGLSERLFDKNANKQYLDKTTAFLAIKDNINEAFDNYNEYLDDKKILDFDIKLDGITKNIRLTEDHGSVKIEVYHYDNNKPCASTKILQCTIDEIKTSIKNESIKLVKAKDKINERIECNKLSKKDKQIYLELSAENKKYYGGLDKYHKVFYLELSDEERVSCDELSGKYKEVYICMEPNNRYIFINKNLEFKNGVTKIYNSFIKEISKVNSQNAKDVVMNKYDKIFDRFFRHN